MEPLSKRSKWPKFANKGQTHRNVSLNVSLSISQYPYNHFGLLQNKIPNLMIDNSSFSGLETGDHLLGNLYDWGIPSNGPTIISSRLLISHYIPRKPHEDKIATMKSVPYEKPC